MEWVAAFEWNQWQTSSGIRNRNGNGALHISHVMRKRRFPLIARKRARVLETRPKTVYRFLLGKAHVTVLLSKRHIEKLATEHVLWP